MAKATSQERRKQILKQRRAQEIHEQGLEDAEFFFRRAVDAHREGDTPAAGRLAKKVLLLDPNHAEALRLLAQIHDVAGHHAEALSYLRQLRKLISDPVVLYNTGVVYEHMGQPENALQTMREFLVATKTFREPKWRRLRESAEALCHFVQLKSVVTKPAAAPLVKPAATPVKLPEVPKQDKAPEPLRATLQFFSTATPSFSHPGTLVEYFLRRQWIELRLAQNFEDLVCLPSLNGVDTYLYQQETVRRVLRHFKGRALLADEVGLGKTIEACLVLKEYWMRGLVRKALVLTPPSLVSQWKGELIEKFGLAPASPDTAEFRRNPQQFWEQEPLVVASIAMARLDAHAAWIAAPALGHGDRG
jgi:tetratricopeptide (TPR) repeat protein